MIYAVEFSSLPVVEKVYSVTRRTVWQLADPYTILLYIKKGSCLLTLDEDSFTLNEGDMFFIPAGQKYIRQPINNEMCTLMYIHFTLSESRSLTDSEALSEIREKKEQLNQSLLEDMPKAEDYTLYIAPHIKRDQKIEAELSSLVQSLSLNASKNHLESAFRNSLYVSQMLAIGNRLTLDSLKDDMHLEKKVPHNLKKAIGYIRSNYTRNISLSDLCAVSSVTKQQMIRYFKESFSTTPIRYITELRINRSKELFLTHSELSVSEVAQELGFSDPHYFSRMFRKISGESPSDFIKRVRNFDEKKQ